VVRRAQLGPDLARHLKIVLDQKLWVDLEELSDEPEGDREDGLPPGRDKVGEIETPAGGVPIFLQRVPGPEGAPIWKISSASVGRIPELYEEFGYGALGELLPPSFFEVQVLEVQLWQWIALLVIATLAYLLSWLAAGLFVRLVRPLVERSDSDFDDRVLQALLGPARLVLFVFLFTVSSRALGLAVPVQRVLTGLEKAAAAVAVTWFLLRIVDVIADVTSHRLAARGQAPAVQFVPLGSKTFKAVLIVLAALAAMDSFGFNVTALIAGLGVGGLAVALAAQKTLENLFGGVTLLADRPVQVGDFCRFGDKIGVVEEIGLRSTRVRTLDRTVVTVPNAEFSTLQLENFAVRDMMRLYTVIGVRYETTPDQMRFLLEELRGVLREHPRVSPDPARVRFVGFGSSSLDLEVYAYVTTSDWNEYLAIREELYLQFMDAVERAGSGFAFPSQTLYLGKDDGLDADAARDAASKGAALREG
jgi:MscS family membrane protein